MFAALVLERAPLTWQDLPGALVTWLQDTGGFAAVALVVVGIFTWLRRTPIAGGPAPPWQRALFRLAVLGMLAGYGLFALLKLAEVFGAARGSLESGTQRVRSLGSLHLQQSCLVLGAACALFAVALPFVADLARLRGRRILALARLSFKEAVRRRVLWGFTGLILVFLFASWFLEHKPENEVRDYVRVVYWTMAPLLLLTATLLAAFSIPTDVRNQTIHTIVTKPVERFEIVLGRFLGYTALMSVVLLAVCAVSLPYMFRQIDEDAKKDSMRARVPVFGVLEFKHKRDPQYKGVNVGREWEYRRYITGGPNTPERAVWIYTDLPAALANRPNGRIPCEFTLDIFRTVKGEEGKGVFATFQFVTAPIRDDRQLETLVETYRRQRDRELAASNADPDAVDSQLAEKLGIYEVPSMEIVDYHTQAIDFPAALLKYAGGGSAKGPGGEGRGPLQVIVKLESGGQYLGMAKNDFYILLAGEPSQLDFSWNFLKGAVGLWLRLCLVIGLAVACSTYLSGVIAWLTTVFIYLAGTAQEFVRSVAQNIGPGGGPMESIVRLVRHESLITPLEQTAPTHLALGIDEVYRWVLRRFLDMLPDVDRFDWTNHVAEGFNIALGSDILLSLLLALGYLLPWAILAYYLMRSREVATW